MLVIIFGKCNRSDSLISHMNQAPLIERTVQEFYTRRLAPYYIFVLRCLHIATA